MSPTCRADELHKGDPFADASVVNRRSNISTNRARTEYRDPPRALRGRAGLSSPTRAVADETSEQKADATPVDQHHSVRRESQTPAHSHLWTLPPWQVRARFETIRPPRGKRC